MSVFSDKIKEGLEQAVAHASGEAVDAKRHDVAVKLPEAGTRMGWITVNLPWGRRAPRAGYPECPDTSALEMAQFGTTMEEIEGRMKALNLDLAFRKTVDAVLNGRPEEEAFAEFGVRSARHAEFLAFREQRSEMRRWLGEHPVMVAHRAACEIAVKRGSFQEFAAPGVQIEMADGSRHLIGDINMLAGVCDDCRAFDSDAVVVRYRVLIGPDSLTG